MPYIAYLFHLLIIPTRAAGNPELEAALPYQQIYLETVLGPVDIQRDHSMKLAPELKSQSPISPSMMLTIWSQRTWKSYNFPRSNS